MCDFHTTRLKHRIFFINPNFDLKNYDIRQPKSKSQRHFANHVIRDKSGHYIVVSLFERKKEEQNLESHVRKFYIDSSRWSEDLISI